MIKLVLGASPAAVAATRTRQGIPPSESAHFSEEEEESASSSDGHLSRGVRKSVSSDDKVVIPHSFRIARQQCRNGKFANARRRRSGRVE